MGKDMNIRGRVMEISRHGNYLKEKTVAYSLPRAGRALVRVSRAGVAFGDLLWTQTPISRVLPRGWVPGYDLSGEIVAIGGSPAQQGRCHFKIGQRVCALAMNGSYAQFIELPLSRLLPVPDNIDDDAACALPLNYLSAWHIIARSAILKRCADRGTRPRILVHSAAGGVGTALLQLARHFNILVYGTASTHKLKHVRALGGTAIDYTRENFHALIQKKEPQGLDAVFESRGLNSARTDRRLLKGTGEIILFGFLEDYSDGKLQNLLRFPIDILGFLMPLQHGHASLYAINPQQGMYSSDLMHIIHMTSAGTIVPIIHKVLPLSEANEAWELLQSRQVVGKLLLAPHSS